MKFTNVKKLLIKFMGESLENKIENMDLAECHLLIYGE